MSNELMVVHERKVHYINLDEDIVEPEDTDFDDDEEEVGYDLSELFCTQQEILKILIAIQKKQLKQDKRFDRIDMLTGANRDVLKVINKKLVGGGAEVSQGD